MNADDDWGNLHETHGVLTVDGIFELSMNGTELPNYYTECYKL